MSEHEIRYEIPSIAAICEWLHEKHITLWAVGDISDEPGRLRTAQWFFAQMAECERFVADKYGSEDPEAWTTIIAPVPILRDPEQVKGWNDPDSDPMADVQAAVEAARLRGNSVVGFMAGDPRPLLDQLDKFRSSTKTIRKWIAGATVDSHELWKELSYWEKQLNEPKAVPERAGREDETQALPTPNDNPPIHDLVAEDLQRRKAIGTKRYGTPLQAHNGRNALVDAYEEALDLTVYLRQKLEEEGWVF